jgi:hypothetical protein
MLEPVVNLTSGLHLVSKVGTRLSTHNLRHPPDSALRAIDPAVYTRYSAAHPRALYIEEGLESEPFANLVLYANGRVTSNPSLSPLEPDHASATVLGRTVLGRTFVEASFRAIRFLADDQRRKPVWSPTVATNLFQTFWIGSVHKFELGVSAEYELHTRTPSVSTYLSWEGSNDRRFRDHTPLEGEDYFFPQRGPSVDSGRRERR